MSHQKKHDKTSLGTLKMQAAQIDCEIQTLDKQIREIDDMITANLQDSKKSQEEYQLKSITSMISACASQREALIQCRNEQVIKKLVIQSLIFNKERNGGLSMYVKKSNLIDTMDTEEISEMLERERLASKIKASKTEELCQVISESEFFDKIHAIVKATSLDDQSIPSAKAEIDAITTP